MLMLAYRLLIYLYPASFRADYGEEMAAIFHARLRGARGAARAGLCLEAVQEVVMNAPALHWDILKQDLRYTVRTLWRAPMFALTAMAVVALGIGANTAAFSVADFVLLRPLPFPQPDRLVTIWQTSPGYAVMELAPGNIHDWKAAATSFEEIGIRRGYSADLIGVGEPRRLAGSAISADLLTTLGAHAAAGRIFAPGEDSARATPTVILSHGLWQTAFGGSRDIIGRKIRLDDDLHEVIGVMPPAFGFPDRSVELWVPLVLSADDKQDRTNNEFYAVARLKPGVTLEAARSELEVLAARSRQLYPKENANTGAVVLPLREELVTPEARTVVVALGGAAVCVLLIVCANLANLLLARALGRRQELAVRAAIGAGRQRLVRQLATESAVLAAAGGTFGVLLGMLILPLLWRLVPVDMPTTTAPAVDLRVLAFATLLTFITAFGFGVAPMLRTGAQADPRGLREGPRTIGGRKDRLRAALVVGEVVVSVVLLVATGLMLRALWDVQARDPGFRSDGILAIRMDLNSNYVVTTRRAQFYDTVIARVRALPDVVNAGFTSGLPMVWGGGIWPVGINGVELERRQDNTASMRFVTPGYLSTVQVPVIRGRDVSEADTMTTEFVAVVSASLVDRYWPGQDALGRKFNFAGRDRTIVGVVGNIRVRGLERESEPQVYLPYRQVRDGNLWGYTPKELVVRTTAPPPALVPAVRTIIKDLDPNQPISAIRTMNDVLKLQTVSRTAQVRVIAGFAVIAFLLAAIGIHGVLSFAVSQRTPEIGVRMALGAQRHNILAMVARQGLLLVGAGLVPGLMVAALVGRTLESLLAGIPPSDVPTFSAVVLLTVIMALAGTLIPTLRAVRVDPIKAIRME